MVRDSLYISVNNNRIKFSFPRRRETRVIDKVGELVEQRCSTKRKEEEEEIV